MYSFIVFVLVIAGIFVFLDSVHRLIEALLYRQIIEGKQTISYKEFISLHVMAPNKWTCTTGLTGNLLFLEEYEYLIYYENGKYKSRPTCIYMKSYRDHNKLKKFSQRKNALDRNNELLAERKKLLENWKNDIEDFQKQLKKK